MFNVADYFKKFSKIEERTVSLRNAVQQAFSDVCGVEKVGFDIRKGVVIVTSNPVIKSIVFMKKKEVLEHLSRTSPSSGISDIR